MLDGKEVQGMVHGCGCGKALIGLLRSLVQRVVQRGRSCAVFLHNLAEND